MVLKDGKYELESYSKSDSSSSHRSECEDGISVKVISNSKEQENIVLEKEEEK